MARARSWGRRIHGMGITMLILLGGCGPAVLEDAGARSEAAPAVHKQEIRIPNSLTTQALVLNALTANRTANQLMATSSLKSLFEPPGDAYIKSQLMDPNAQVLMSYVVGCALGAGQELKWSNPLTGGQEKWQGILGLCPDWATQAPTQGCLERVSSCLLARNNAFGWRVELSVRGEHPDDPSFFQLEPQTRPSEWDSVTAAQVASVNDCTSHVSGLNRNCGWALDYIGSCQPGDPVRVGAGGRSACTGAVLGSSSGGQMMLRVCSGVSGCDDVNGGRVVGQSDGGNCSATEPSVEFACPQEGYFSVMTAPVDPGVPGVAQVEAEAPAHYPLSEGEVFQVREGAYYGNIFDWKAIAQEVKVVNGVITGRDQVITGSVYRKMYSCYDSGWTNGLAYSTYRVCALPNSNANCAAQVVGPCWDPEAADSQPSACSTDDGANVEGDGDFEQCRDTESTVWSEPVTVFLNAACDLVTKFNRPDLCKR